MRSAGLAAPEGTEAYARRFEKTLARGHFRSWNGLTLSSIGLGTYLGPHDDATDAAYRSAVMRALELGGNVVDTAVNYRFQRSERAVGDALAEAMASGLPRDAVFVSTKGGFIPFDVQPPANASAWIEERLVRTGIAPADEIVGGCH